MFGSLLRDVPRERRRLIATMAILASVIVVLNYCGDVWHLYQNSYFGYDKILHFVAGTFCGVFGLWLFHPSGIVKEQPYALCVTLLVAFWVGFGWEVFEVIRDRPNLAAMFYWDDTLGDMIADIFGGGVVGLVYKEKG